MQLTLLLPPQCIVHMQVHYIAAQKAVVECSNTAGRSAARGWRDCSGLKLVDDAQTQTGVGAISLRYLISMLGVALSVCLLSVSLPFTSKWLCCFHQ